MEGDTVVVHEVSKSFVIRYGQSVLGIRNDGYSPMVITTVRARRYRAARASRATMPMHRRTDQGANRDD